ncbi:MAG: hypothetical protein ACU841_03325 [Gammaproteobacteria bacterium]
MKNTNRDDPTEKALRERYARLLDLDEADLVTREARRPSRIRLRSRLLLLGFMVAVLGACLFFILPVKKAGRLNRATPQDSLQQQASRGESESFAESLGDSDVSEPSNPGVPTDTGRPQDSGETGFRPSGPPDDGGPIPEQTASAAFLVVLLSTKSKHEAIERAKALNGEGYPAEVILSSTGFYAVALRHETYEHAEASLKTIVASAAVKERPYIMTADRVEKQIYSEIE